MAFDGWCIWESNRRLRGCLLPIIFLIILLPFSAAGAGTIPELMLADIYRQGIDLSQYRVSEKLDGIRARGDGAHLISRGGNVFAAPEWLTKGLPTVPLDGELWMGRGQYEEVSSVVRTQQPHLVTFPFHADVGQFHPIPQACSRQQTMV